MTRLLNGLILITAGILIGGLIRMVSVPPRGEPVQLQPPPTPGPITVHVAGAVASPGVYELPRGARVIDAIETAGGLTADAGATEVNLAAVLEDGMQVVVPAETPASEAAENGGSGPPANPGGLVNINTANRAQLESLPGIGPTIAGRILEYRAANGAFEKIGDIVHVSGIGPSTFDTIKDLITVGD